MAQGPTQAPRTIPPHHQISRTTISREQRIGYKVSHRQYRHAKAL